MTIQLRKASFRKWLEAKPPGEPVGRRHECFNCPLAHFLLAQGAPCPDVESSTFTLGSDGSGGSASYRRLPTWARRFLQHADRPDAWGAVTAGTALLCLELSEGGAP